MLAPARIEVQSFASIFTHITRVPAWWRLERMGILPLPRSSACLCSVQERNEPVGAMVAPWPLHEL
jgi:hypothetical protein